MARRQREIRAVRNVSEIHVRSGRESAFTKGRSRSSAKQARQTGSGERVLHAGWLLNAAPRRCVAAAQTFGGCVPSSRAVHHRLVLLLCAALRCAAHRGSFSALYSTALELGFGEGNSLPVKARPRSAGTRRRRHQQQNTTRKPAMPHCQRVQDLRARHGRS
ncbi:hypothetical protein CB0940_07944 [Cercospora beticola]|uniref:Uncharacterized protein n=1 Tax=Cercospora beticola TaxID=122368 RepID=A0A2G5H898_CERBT|nr:hypothetical protein CB0940_07944 [Cercospora beticola]PIA88755.1 hypothetical protein CB0940_07944 [Cercospora beticola]